MSIRLLIRSVIVALIAFGSAPSRADSIALLMSGLPANPGTVALNWSGEPGPFLVYRSTNPANVLNNPLAQTSALTLMDTPPIVTLQCYLVGAYCSDGRLDGDESDVDCGGSCPVRCADGSGCAGGGDCASGVCASGACQVPTCADGVQNGQETGVDCGGPCPSCPVVLMIAVSASGAYGSEMHPAGAATWSAPVPLGAPSTDAPDIAFTSGPLGVAVVHYMHAGDPNDNALVYTTWNAGSWTAFAGVGAATTRSAPAISASGTTAQVVYQGFDFHYYHAAFNGSWSPTAEPVPGAAGSAAADITARGTDATVAFGTGTSALAAQDESAGTWQSAVTIAPAFNGSVPPAIVTMTAGPELMVAYVASNNAVMFSTRSAGIWSPPASIQGALTQGSVALAALASGNAILAYRGTDTNIYWTAYSGGAWSAVAPLYSPNMSILGSPSLAPGTHGATAEIAFVGTNGTAYHSRLVGSTWTAPTPVVNNVSRVAIASSP